MGNVQYNRRKKNVSHATGLDPSSSGFMLFFFFVRFFAPRSDALCSCKWQKKRASDWLHAIQTNNKQTRRNYEMMYFIWWILLKTYGKCILTPPPFFFNLYMFPSFLFLSFYLVIFVHVIFPSTISQFNNFTFSRNFLRLLIVGIWLNSGLITLY